MGLRPQSSLNHSRLAWSLKTRGLECHNFSEVSISSCFSTTLDFPKRSELLGRVKIVRTGKLWLQDIGCECKSEHF